LSSDKGKQITHFDFVVTRILGFDKNAKSIFVEATGTDPKGLQVYKVNRATGKATQITKDGGTHRTQLSDSGDFLIDNYSSLSTPRKQAVINIQTKECEVLLEAENPLKDYVTGTTEFVKLKAANGMDLEARIIKPKNFDVNKKYPVLVYVYGGPHAQLVTDTWLGGASMWMHYLAAEEDYIVFTVDGRGSAHRGFAFESGIHRNQGGVNMEDQMTGVAYLKSLAYVDADRLAIHGWSYGGFMTISMMLRHPEVFTTGVAGGPVTDWKYYEVMYGERYMDTPQENQEGYENTRVHKYIKNLEGDLLIIHGSVDDTVVPQHSMTLLKEAVEQGVQLDFFTYPMHPHNVRGRDRVHLMEKVIRYIIKNNK
jgi:dipeptidyl-peptidase-4